MLEIAVSSSTIHSRARDAYAAIEVSWRQHDGRAQEVC